MPSILSGKSSRRFSMAALWCVAQPMPALITGLALALVSACSVTPSNVATLSLERQGSFAVGGTILGDPRQSSLHCDHGYVDFQIPVNARSTSLLMWHSASAAAWQQRWDGGEGFQSMMLRERYPVYLWDGPRVGRANWGCEAYTYQPVVGRDQQNFEAWRLGSGSWPNFYPGVQFPTTSDAAWNQATRARYDEFDSVANAQLQAEAAAELIDCIGPTVALTNSAGGLRALLTALRTDKLVGLVAYENVGYVFPEGEGPDVVPGIYGPVEVPLDDFMKLTRFPMQLVWGDNLDKAPERFKVYIEHSRIFVDLINKYGGHAEFVYLPDHGLHGNTHIPFADLNNAEVAGLLNEFLQAHDLD